MASLTLYVGIRLAKYAANLSKEKIAEKTNDPLMTNFLYKSIKLGLYVLVGIFALHIAGLGGLATGLLTAAGASAVIFGFAFKDIGENFISGVILSFNRPFKINDTILIDDIFGQIQSMEFRYTKLKTFDGRDVYIPNSDVIRKPVFNYTEDGYCRMEFKVGIGYRENIELTEKLILKTVGLTKGVVKDIDHEIYLVIDELATTSVILKVIFWVNSTDYRKEALKIKSDVITNVKRALNENNTTFPTDIPELKLYQN
jgi:small-conductance mechanosensitive channel